MVWFVGGGGVGVGWVGVGLPLSYHSLKPSSFSWKRVMWLVGISCIFEEFSGIFNSFAEFFDGLGGF